MALDILLGRTGESLRGRVLNSVFHIRTPFWRLSVATPEIRRRYFQAPGSPPRDEIYLRNFDKLVGTIEDQTIEFRPATGAELAVPTAAVLVVLFEFVRARNVLSLLAAAKPLSRRRGADASASGLGA